MVIYSLIYFVFLMSKPRNSTWFGLNSTTFSYVKRSSSELCWLYCPGKSKLILNSFKWRLVSCLNPFLQLLCCPICTYTLSVLRNGSSPKLCSLPCESLARFLLAPWKEHVLASFSVPLRAPMCLFSHLRFRGLSDWSWHSLRVL